MGEAGSAMGAARDSCDDSAETKARHGGGASPPPGGLDRRDAGPYAAWAVAGLAAAGLAAFRLLAALRFFGALRLVAFAALPMRKSSRLPPALTAARSQRGSAPRPDQVLPDLSRYFGATLRPASLLLPIAFFGRPRAGALPGRRASW